MSKNTFWCQHNGDCFELCRLRLARLNEEMREDNEVIQGEHEMQSYGFHCNRVVFRIKIVKQYDLLQFKLAESEAEVEE